MFVTLSNLFLTLYILHLALAKSSFNLSDLKYRQHRHDRAKHVQRDLLGLGDPLGNPLGLFPPASPSSSAASSSSASSSASVSKSDSTTPTPTPSPSGGLLGLPIPSIPIGVGSGGGILPSIPLGNPSPSSNSSPSPSNSESSSSSSGSGNGLGLGGGGILPSITLGLGNPNPSSSSSASASSHSSDSGNGIIPPIVSVPPILPTTPIVSIPPILPTTPVVSIPPILPTTPIVSIPPILPTTPIVSIPTIVSILPSSPIVTVPPILPTSPIVSILPSSPILSIPPILPSSPIVSILPSTPIVSLPSILPSSILPSTPIVSIPIPTGSSSGSGSSSGGGILPTITLPSISIPIIGSSSSGSSTVIGLPTISIPPIGSSSSSQGSSSSSSSGNGVIPTISITLPTSIGLPTGSSSGSSGSSSSGESRSSVSSVGQTSVPASLSTGSTMTISTIFQSATTPTSSILPTSIGSQYSFITVSSLQFTSIPTTTPAGTQTDPDQATSTISVPSSGGPATLPANVPQMILPNPPLDTSPSNLAGFTLITLLFTPQLGYEFVLQHEQTQGQIWAFMPQAIGNALAIDPSNVKALWLKPYQPAGTNGSVASLMTLYNAYIPTNMVNNMAQQLKTPKSLYFTISQGVAGELANFTEPDFPLLYVADPYSSSDGSSNPGNTSVSANGAASNRRKDAIIAVCTIIGVIGLLVLAWWAFKNYKKRQEGAHRRLADPLGLDRGYGATDNIMRERPPSVGPDGIRRNSFYFAEDSLRGYRDQVRDMEEEAQLNASMGGRRHMQGAVGAAISGPILRDNTLNW